MSESITIFQEDGYRLEFHGAQKPSENLAFTFTESGFHDLNKPGFGVSFLGKNGFDVLSIKTVADNWYQDVPSGLTKAIAHFQAETAGRYSKKVSYGSSMGGYAAIQFSKLFGIDIALAISPQFDVTADWDNRWASVFKKNLPFITFSKEFRREQCKYIIAYDPWDKDALHYKKFSEIIPVVSLDSILVRHSGHPASTFLAHAGILKETVLNSLNGRGAGSPAKALRGSRRTFPRYFFNLSTLCLTHKKLIWAQTAMREAVSAEPLNAEYLIRLAQIENRCGDIIRAIQLATTAVAIDPKHPHMAGFLSELFMIRRMKPQALHFIDIALEQRPNSEHFSRQREQILGL